jgi:hypothetical protein
MIWASLNVVTEPSRVQTFLQAVEDPSEWDNGEREETDLHSSRYGGVVEWLVLSVERVPKGKSGSPSIFTITTNYNLQMMTELQHHFFTEDHSYSFASSYSTTITLLPH